MISPPFSAAVHYGMGHELENGLRIGEWGWIRASLPRRSSGAAPARHPTERSRATTPPVFPRPSNLSKRIRASPFLLNLPRRSSGPHLRGIRQNEAGQLPPPPRPPRPSNLAKRLTKDTKLSGHMGLATARSGWLEKPSTHQAKSAPG